MRGQQSCARYSVTLYPPHIHSSNQTVSNFLLDDLVMLRTDRFLSSARNLDILLLRIIKPGLYNR